MTNVTHAKKFQVKQIDVVTQQTVNVKAEKHTAYQLFNDKKQRIKPSKTVKKGKDLLIYTEDVQEPSVILVDYYQHFTVLDPMELSQLDATFATTSRLVESIPTTITAKATSNTMPMVADTGSSGLGWKIGLGTLVLGGAGAGIASASRGKDKHQETQGQQPSVPKTEIKFNTVTQDNIINRQEAESPAIELSGRIQHLQTGDVVAIYIGQSRHVVSVKDGQFSLMIDGKTLAVHQVISAEVVRKGVKVATATHQYTVDTQIDTPTITFRPIAGDDIINLNESKNKVNVSGTVKNAKDGDEIIVSCGCPTCTGVKWIDIKTKVVNGGFSVDFNGSDMVGNGRNIIKANVTTTDNAQNMATGTAEKKYTVDLVAPNPSFNYEQIGGNNIINAELAKNAIVLKGKVQNVENQATVNVKVSVNDKEYIATKQGEYYQVAIASREFANGNPIKWHITVRDKAGNDKVIEQSQQYIYDVLLNKPTLTIEQNNPVVHAKSTGLTLSGRLNFDNDVEKSSVKVSVLLKGQTHIATVNTVNKTWSIDLPESIVKQAQGDNDYTVKIAVRDIHGNTAENLIAGRFHVDTVAPQVQISLNNIAEIMQTGSEKVAVSGRVTGEFKTTDRVKLLFNGTELSTNIASNGVFTFDVPRQALLDNSDKKITVSLNTQDNVGNSSQVSAEKYYQVNNTVSIQLNSITGDNLINVTEAKKATTTISGTVHNLNTDRIQLNIGKEIQATVKNGQFSVDVNTRDLIANPTGKISASLNHQGKSITTHRNYAVAPDAVAKIHLNDVNLGLVEEIGSVRLSGKLNFNDSIFNQNLNKHFLQGLILKIGNKEFIVGINQQDYSFFVDLSQEQYQELKGQDISHEFISYTNIIMPYITPENKWHQDSDLITYEIEENGVKQYGVVSLKSDAGKRELGKVTLDFHDENVHASRQLNLTLNDKTTLNGHISGGKIGDEIILEVGDKNYHTKVQNNQQFSLEIENSDLRNITTIRAILKTKDNANTMIDVFDNARIISANDISDEFVNRHEFFEHTNRVIKHSDPNYNFAYFIHAHIPGGTPFYYWLNKLPLGGSEEVATIKYYFATEEDFKKGLIDAHVYKWYNDKIQVVNHTLEYKLAAKSIYDEISSYINNVQFIETNNLQEADTVLTVGDLSTGGGGYASAGGSMVLFPPDVNGYIGGGKHEILHNLGTLHTGDVLSNLDYAKHEVTGETSYMSNVDGFKIYSNRLSYNIFDLAYLHYRFGVNKNHNSGNNTYGFQNYTATTPDTGIYIWDGAGVDTFDASDEKESVNVDLTPGSWIYRGEISDTFLIKNKTRVDEVWKEYIPFLTSQGLIISPYDHKIEYVTGQAFIGYGTQIENLIGSNHADVLKGNKADNNIFGGDGNDQIWGDAGNDYLDGGKGVDTLYGGDGNDIFVVDNTADQVIETNTNDIDTIYAHVDYTLSNNIENLYLFGNAINGTGNQLNNTLQGNDLNNTLSGGAGDDRINGGRGSDTLTGGAGQDVFIFNDILDGTVDTITDFNVNEDKIALALKIFDSLTAQNIKNHMKYDADTGHLSYDADANGQVDAIHFATLNKGLDDTKIIYEII